MFRSSPYYSYPSYGYPGAGYGYSNPNANAYHAAALAQAQAEEQRRRQAAIQRQRQIEEERAAREQQFLRAQRLREAQARRARNPYAWFSNPYSSNPYEADEPEEEQDDEDRYDYGFGHMNHRSSPMNSANAPRTKIPVRSPSPPARRRAATPPKSPSPAPQQPPTSSSEEKPEPVREYSEADHQAASTIQSHFRTHMSHRLISSIYTKFQALTANFVLPEVLDFTDPTNPEGVISIRSEDGKPVVALSPHTLALLSSKSQSTKPRLAYTAASRPLLSQIEELSRLLTQLDGVESWGDAGVRQRRKATVKEIEKTLDDLEGREELDEEDGDMEKGWRGVWRKFVRGLQGAEVEETVTATSQAGEQEQQADDMIVDSVSNSESAPTAEASTPATTAPESDISLPASPTLAPSLPVPADVDVPSISAEVAATSAVPLLDAADSEIEREEVEEEQFEDAEDDFELDASEVLDSLRAEAQRESESAQAGDGAIDASPQEQHQVKDRVEALKNEEQEEDFVML